jgi:mitochondrial translocator assembly and maintenance protein 41
MEGRLSFDPEKLLEKYHQPEFVIAYGSGVFREQALKEATQIDFVFGVQNPVEWHERNLSRNTRDYSLAARACGPEVIANIQRKGAGVYYHPFVPFEGKQIKYGVVALEDLTDDLERWSHLYLAGRLQKPVLIIRPSDQINDLIRRNLRNAVDVSLLLLPRRFTEEQLFMTVASLSYTGDSRKSFGVDPGKVERIVKGNFERFRNLYKSTITTLINHGTLKEEEEGYSQDKEKSLEQRNWSCLPKSIVDKVGMCPYTLQNVESAVRKAISEIVHASSVSQTQKGIFSAGIWRSAEYAWEKLKKAKMKD